MKLRLAGHLGLRSTFSVLRALGRLRDDEAATPDTGPSAGGLSRKAFLQVLGGTIAAISLTGNSAAAATSRAASAKWLETNAKYTPHTYADTLRLPRVHWRQFYATFSVPEKRQFWLDNLTRYRQSRSVAETARAERTLADFEHYLLTTSVFEEDVDPDADLELAKIENALTVELSKDAARALLTLGEPGAQPSSEAAARDCECSVRSSFCMGSYCKSNDRCTQTPPCCPGGCGALWKYTCDGMCQY